jgi:uncharacterized protein
MNERIIDRPFVLPALVIGISILGGLWVLSAGISSRGADSTITVTGSATQNVQADQAKWRIEIRRTAYSGGTASAYAQIARDGEAVKKYFQDQKLASSSITASVISTDENYKQYASDPTTYNVSETITIETTDVEKIDQLSRQLGALSSKIDAGTLLSPQQPEYFVSTLPQLRVSLIGKAVQDARARAVEIAKSGSTTVGALKSASSGVVQVLSPNSTNVEDYGSYDTSTIQKQVMVTARAVFYVQ